MNYFGTTNSIMSIYKKNLAYDPYYFCATGFSVLLVRKDQERLKEWGLFRLEKGILGDNMIPLFKYMKTVL